MDRGQRHQAGRTCPISWPPTTPAPGEPPPEDPVFAGPPMVAARMRRPAVKPQLHDPGRAARSLAPPAVTTMVSQSSKPPNGGGPPPEGSSSKAETGRRHDPVAARSRSRSRGKLANVRVPMSWTMPIEALGRSAPTAASKPAAARPRKGERPCRRGAGRERSNPCAGPRGSGVSSARPTFPPFATAEGDGEAS